MINIKRIRNSHLNSITYILTSTKDECCVLIDCGFSDELIPTLLSNRAKIKAVFLTHIHYDHIYGLNRLLEHFPDTLVYTNEEGRDALTDTKKNFSKYHPEIEPFVFGYPNNVRLLKESEVEIFEGEKMQILYTPGHDVTCFSFIANKFLFTGDAYIPGVKTIMNFPRSSRDDAKNSLTLLKKLEKQGYIICPGHDIACLNTLKVSR